jgi:cobalt-zinc-cadmium efflux system outer membrane protein
VLLPAPAGNSVHCRVRRPGARGHWYRSFKDMPLFSRTQRACLRAVLALTCAAASPAMAQSPLGLHDAVQLAVHRAAGLEALQASARGFRESAVAAAQRPDPMLSLSLANLPVNGADRFSTTRDFMTMRSIGLMQTFTREDKLRARALRAEREAEAALAEHAARAAAVQRDTAFAWFERRAQEQRVAVLCEHLAVAQQQVQAADAAARGGRAALADSLAARDAVAQVRQELLAAEADATSAQRSLARWTGTAPDRPLGPAPSLSPQATDHAPNHAMAPDRQARHPELLQLAAREAAAGAEVEVARQERVPDVSVELMFSQRGSRYSNMASVAVSLPLPWDRPQRQDRELAARLAQAEALRAEREERARELQAETAGWNDGWQAGLARLALMDAEREPLARQRIEAALGAYRGGSAPLAQVLEAQRMALALQLERIGVELETARQWARLAFLTPIVAKE